MNEKDSKNDMLFFMVCVPFRLLIAYGLHHIFKHDTNTHTQSIYLFFLASIGLGLIIADTRRRYFDTEKKGFLRRRYFDTEKKGFFGSRVSGTAKCMG